ncbi:hypothetical protein VZT92_004313 [Zoarces viviparus]|uniref:HECT domain-containing protein n=1 Tax=Zoarces viviparus TaxID=48416 RepID=A0AAW1FY84_ZOAVI
MLCFNIAAESIVRAIILHAVLRLQPMLEQLREGLQLYDLILLIRKYPDICQPLFVPGEDVKVNAEFVMASIIPQLSDKGTTRHQVELEMINFIQDLLYEAEAEDHEEDEDGPRSITPARFLQWITGQACTKTIALPVRHVRSYVEFKKVMMEAFHLGQGFHNV